MAEDDQPPKKQRKLWQMEPTWCPSVRGRYCRVEDGQNNDKGAWMRWNSWKRHAHAFHLEQGQERPLFVPLPMEEGYLYLEKCVRCEEGFGSRQQFLRHCGLEKGQEFGEDPQVLLP